MRRRSRNVDNVDSLELLLDTVCNMFGGVIFIAILLAILAGRPGTDIEHRDAEAEAQDALQQEVKRLEQTLATLLGVGGGNSSFDAEVIGLMAERAGAEQRLQAAQSQINRLRVAGSTIEERDTDILKRRALLVGMIKERETQISDQQRLRVSAARLPVARATGKIPIHVVLRGSRAYEVYANDGRGGYIEQSLDVEIGRRGPNKDEDHIRLKDPGGIPVNQVLRGHPRWKQILGRISADRHFFYIMVYPSGCGSFLAFRDTALQAGFEYDVILLPEDTEIVLRPGSDFGTQ